ncbi:uncharacterized protein LOC131689850 [Topomyia yanbarensis]|uniref:uncharacterized protein LOC131689850 n=1 Tax=Topomyia yanbarensis TaxID=2498891 RepID=UPI00273B4EB6|nr:uncharacterized protein LOC131689850 [Topomyia yanbarensis]
MDSLSEIVIALLKNSLDANSSSIAIRVCLELFWIQVLDNGDGISKEELQSIGNCCLLNIDFEKKKQTKQFARLTGSSLTEIVNKCEEVLIESLDGLSRDAKSHSRLFKQSIRTNERSQRNFDSVSQYNYARKSRGTTVTLKNIFCEEPERQRNHSIKEDYRKLLADLRVQALIHYNRSFTLQDLSSSEVVFKSKKHPTLLTKYCELYNVTETDVEVTTCRKDSILAECFFSPREARRGLDPVQFTFVNGVSNNELLPTVNEILTQSKHAIDFLIIVTFPKNDLLTQQVERVVKNCLLRCLSQYKDCLNRRKERTSTPPAAVMQNPETPLSHRFERQQFAEKKSPRRPDDEDILYGLSQPIDNRYSTFQKCTKWLQTNDFDIPEKGKKNHRSEKYALPQNERSAKEMRQKIDFFGVRHEPLQKRVGRKSEVITPDHVPPKRLPIPKFYPEQLPTISKARPIIRERHQPASLKRDDSPLKQTKLESLKQVPKRGGFLDSELIKKESKLTFHCHDIAEKSAKWKQFENKKKNGIVHATKQPILPQPSELFLEESIQGFDLEKSSKPADRTSFLNLCPAEFDVFEASFKPEQSLDSIGSDYPENHSPGCNTLPNVFTEPLFLEPILEEDRYATSSPKARYFGNDLLEGYEDFHRACWETIQHYKIAIDEIESSSSECGHCSRSPFSREIETLRQPFLHPRDIYAQIGSKRY